MSASLAGKRVLITGGAVRFGAVLCRHFAETGAEIVVHYRTSGDAAEQLVKELPHSGGQIHTAVNCDLADPMTAMAMLDNLPQIDILVNNASVWMRADGITPGAQRKQEAVNFTTPCRLMEYHAAQGIAGACAINIADAAVLCSDFRPATPYLKAKADLVQSTKQFATRFAPNYRVNTVAPGPMISPRNCPNTGMRKVKSALPLQRPVSPDDVANAVLFLALNQSITGVILPVDCGCSLLKNSPY